MVVGSHSVVRACLPACCRCLFGGGNSLRKILLGSNLVCFGLCGSAVVRLVVCLVKGVSIAVLVLWVLVVGRWISGISAHRELWHLLVFVRLVYATVKFKFVGLVVRWNLR